MAASGMSFQKKARSKVVQISGTKPSLHNNQLLVSTGVPSLDSCIGGGLAIGTVLLIEEDQYGSYSRMLLKYYLAEGVMNKHHIHLASTDVSPQQIMQELPAPLIDDPGSEVEWSQTSSQADNQDMKIAWRYQHLPEVKSSPGSSGKFGHYYDLTKTMSDNLIEQTGVTLHEPNSQMDRPQSDKVMNPTYRGLLSSIKTCIHNNGFDIGGPHKQQHNNVLRIGIHSLGSPQWGEEGADTDASLCRFLYSLRSLLRNAYASCILTVPTHLFQHSGFTKRIEHLCDTVIHLESFEGSEKEKNPAFKEYRGLVHCVKLAHLNSLTSYMPDTLDLAFKLRRKKFSIEKLHLPPELSETASRNQEDPVLPRQPNTIGCGMVNSKLDF